MSENASQVWAIVATVALKPLYRPEGLSQEQWRRHLEKLLPGTSKVWLLSDDVLRDLRPSLVGFVRVGGHYRRHPDNFRQTRLSMVWLFNWRLELTDKHPVVNVLAGHVFAPPEHYSFYRRMRPDLKREELLEWAGSDEAKTKAEEVRLNLIEFQQAQQRNAGITGEVGSNDCRKEQRQIDR